MLAKFQNHIAHQLPFLNGRKLLLAVSGGVDSMVLLHLCHHAGLDIAVAHCNFQLRAPESDGDEAFVVGVCEALKVPVFVQRFDTLGFATQHKLSIQAVARKIRYDWFYTLLAQQQFDFILTAHQLDDCLETFLINFTRGSGLDGLTGIPEKNDKVIRPLLPFSRKELEEFAKAHQIDWREDSSNAGDKYLRNKIRHTVVPVLKELNPSLLEAFQKTIQHLKQSQSLVQDAAESVYKKVVNEEENHTGIDLGKLLKYRNYKAYLFEWLRVFGFSDWTAVYELVAAQSGKQVLSETHILLKNRESLLLFPRHQSSMEAVFWVDKGQTQVKVPLKLEFCNVNDISLQSTNVIFVDEDKLQFPLTLRRWQEGDFFQPFGMNGRKKLSKYFKDEKFSLLDKNNVWLLCSENQIVWIVGKRQDERFKVTADTRNILKINLTE